jgi:hypothetical protein
MTNKEYQKEWYQKNKERIKEERKQYYIDNKDNIIEYRKNNSEKIKESNKDYINKNKDIINEKRRNKHKEKINSNNLYRIKHNLRSMFSRIFKTKNFHKVSKSELILGCSFETFKTYIESKFEPWMNWDNYGLYNGELNHGWDIDHIIPICNAITVDEIIKLNHYTNLQPLCSHYNRYIKKDNLI